MFGVNRPGIWVALGLSVVLHLTGFRLAEILPREPLSSSPSLVKPSIRLIQPTKQLNVITARPTIAKPRADNQSAGARDLPTPAPIQNNAAEQPPARSGELKAESVFSKSIRYFYSSEVDSNSELLEEWILQTQVIRSSAIVSIQLTLYINEAGSLDKFVVLNSSLSDIETDLLLQDLALTIFRPALKDEKPVPSQKDVEIVLDPNPPVFHLPNFLNRFSPKNK
jgi:hypothetical protein